MTLVDTLQAVFLIVGLGTLLVKGTLDAGGFNAVLETADATGRLREAIFRYNPSPFQYNNFWIAVIGGM